jgi:prepilin peptidase CpaA
MRVADLTTDWRLLVAAVGRFAFVSLVVVAALGDVRARRIPNRLNLVLALLGLAVAVVTHELAGLQTAALALGTGLLIWFPVYALGWVGAGDAKFVAAAATWLTPWAAVRASVLGAVLGAVLAVIWMVRVRGLAFSMTRLAHAAQNPKLLREPLPVHGRDARIPYGVALAAGLLAEAVRLWRGP